MKLSSYIPVALLAVSALAACSDDLENVENRVYDTSSHYPATVLIDGMANESTQTFTVNMANKMTEDVSVTYHVDNSLVEAYNLIYGANAVALPAENYELVQPTATFLAGAVTSSNVEVKITDLLSLDRNLVYVLPLTVVNSTVPVIESQKTRYIVVRGAALINVAPNIANNYASLVSPDNASGLNGIKDLTIQCLLYVEEFGGSDSNIQSIMGIEGTFLFRISDSGLPADQIQLACSSNATDASWTFPAKKWSAITFTYEGATGNVTMYLNGVKKGTAKAPSNLTVNWGNDSFYVGKSWNDNRWLNGMISEARVWNRILSDAEIANADQPYFIKVPADGLVAYWKFNEGAGTLIKDYANGYDLNLASDPKWTEVSLPE